MSHNDFLAHNRGKRHRLALSKADANLRPLPKSADIAPADNRLKDTQGRGMVRSNETTSTAGHSNSLAVHGSADPPVGSSVSEMVPGSTFSANTVKQKTNNAKRSKKVKQPKSIVESITGPPASAGNRYVCHATFYSTCSLSLFSVKKIVKEIRLKLHQCYRSQSLPSPPCSRSFQEKERSP